MMKVKWTSASIGHIPFLKASQCFFLLSIFRFSECSLFIWLRNVQYIINNVDVYVKTLPRFFIFVEIKGSEKQGKIRKSTCTLKKTKLTFLCIFMHVCALFGFLLFLMRAERSVASLWGSCQVFVINHIFEYFLCSKLSSIIWVNILFVSFRNIFNHMEVHRGDKTPGENCSTTPG